MEPQAAQAVPREETQDAQSPSPANDLVSAVSPGFSESHTHFLLRQLLAEQKRTNELLEGFAQAANGALATVQQAAGELQGHPMLSMLGGFFTSREDKS